MILDRLLTLFRRRRKASKLGIKFHRCASFRLPETIFFNGQSLALDLPDENGVKVAFIDLLLDDCYGCQSLKDKGVQINSILDIGANVGLFGLVARSVFPSAKIHSYEPNQELESYLAIQAKSAKFNYFMEAVGHENAMISLDINKDSVQTRSRKDSEGNVQQTAFKEVIARLGGKIDFLKIDCEGAEWDLFKDKESWSKVGNLSMEYHLFEKNQSLQLIKKTILSLGFKIIAINHSGCFGLLIATRDN